MNADALFESALDAADLVGHPAISVFAADDATATLRTLLEAVYVPHKSLRLSTVERVRTAGFTIRRTGRYPHCSIDFSEAPRLAEARRLADCFDPPIRNPSARDAR